MNLKRLFESHPHWQEVIAVCEQLQSAGHQTLLVGGCVRDALRGVKPQDFDIATAALPDQVTGVFPEALDIGRQFGVMILPRGDFRIEVATFRHDGPYVDGRRPEHVKFSTARDDAERRDFTVNALFYDPQTENIIDYVDGLKDLRAGLLRAVGNAEERFREDKLRILRAVRFAAQLDYQIEEQTLKAIIKWVPQLHVVSKERVTEEIKKLIKTDHVVRGVALLKDTGLFASILPGTDFLESKQKWPQFQQALARIADTHAFTLFLSLVSVLADGASPEMSRPYAFEKSLLLLSREEKKDIHEILTGLHLLRTKKTEALIALNSDNGPLITELAYALSHVELFPLNHIHQAIDRFLELCNENGELPKPYLNGQDLLQMGMAAGAHLGEVLAQAYMQQLNGQLTSRQSALDWAQKQKT